MNNPDQDNQKAPSPSHSDSTESSGGSTITPLPLTVNLSNILLQEAEIKRVKMDQLNQLTQLSQMTQPDEEDEAKQEAKQDNWDNRDRRISFYRGDVSETRIYNPTPPSQEAAPAAEPNGNPPPPPLTQPVPPLTQPEDLSVHSQVASRLPPMNLAATKPPPQPETTPETTTPPAPAPAPAPVSPAETSPATNPWRERFYTLFKSRQRTLILKPSDRMRLFGNIACKKNTAVRSLEVMLDASLHTSRSDLLDRARDIDRYMTRTFIKRDKEWVGKQLADMLIVVWDIFEANKHASKMKNLRKKKFKKDQWWMADFDNFFQDCENVLKDQDEKERRTSLAPVGGGGKAQEKANKRTVSIKPPKVMTINGWKDIQFQLEIEIPDWKDKTTVDTCPVCGHDMLIESMEALNVGSDSKDIEEEYSEKLKETGKKKDPKPVTKKHPEMYYACMCVVSKARDIVEGTGCKLCENNKKKTGEIAYDLVSGKTSCEVCQCPCNAYYKQRRHADLVAQMALLKITDKQEEEKKTKKKKEPEEDPSE